METVPPVLPVQPPEPATTETPVDSSSEKGLKTSKNKLVMVLLVAVAVAALTGLFALTRFLLNRSSKSDKKTAEKVAETVAPTLAPKPTLSSEGEFDLTPGEETAIDSAVFGQLNIHRGKKSLPLVQKDDLLCAFAKRRVTLTEDNDHYGGTLDLNKETQNKTIWQTYLTDYSKVSELEYDPLNPQVTGEMVVDYWDRAGDRSSLNKTEYQYGCVRSDNKYLILILAIHR